MFILPFAANVAAEGDAPVSSEHHMRNSDPNAEAKAVARAEAKIEAKEVEQSMSKEHHMKSTAITAPASEAVQKAEHTMKNN
jgi:hypothetical protein